VSFLRAIVPISATVLIVASCKGADAPPRDAAQHCDRDEDCQAPPCGPCSSGSTISGADLDKECVVNPCTASGAPAPIAYCNRHACTIR